MFFIQFTKPAATAVAIVFRKRLLSEDDVGSYFKVLYMFEKSIDSGPLDKYLVAYGKDVGYLQIYRYPLHGGECPQDGSKMCIYSSKRAFGLHHHNFNTYLVLTTGYNTL